MALNDFFRKAKKKVGEELGDAGAVISKGFSSLGKMARSYRDKIADSKVGAYMAPAPQVRTRDFIRETPKATLDVGKSLFTGTVETAKNVPKIFGEGAAYALNEDVREQYKKGNVDILPTVTKVTPTKMLSDTARSMLELGTLGRGPKWGASKNPIKRVATGSSVGYGMDVAGRGSEKGELSKEDFVPGMNTLAGGLLSGLARPTAEMAQEAIKDAKVAVEDIKRLPKSKRTTVIPGSTENVSRGIYDSTPNMGTFTPGKGGKLEKTDGFNYKHKEGKFSYPDQEIVEPWIPQSSLLKGVLKPGMRIEAVKDPIAQKNAKAKALIDAQIAKLKNGATKAEEGFVMPNQVTAKPKAKLTGDPVADFKASLDAEIPSAPTLQKGLPYNKFQEKAFREKKERVEALRDVVEAPEVLRAMGYTKKAAERLGIDEQKIIARLGKLGYRKGDPILDDVRSDMVKRILENQVPKQSLKEYYDRKRSLNTNFLEGIDPASLKDISARRAGWVDVFRNMKEVFGENFDKVKSKLLDPFDESKGNFITERDQFLKELEDNVVNKFGIQKGSKESAAIQRYGDPDLPEGERMTYEDLLREFGKEKADQIVAADTWFRETYDKMIDELNLVREFYFPTHPLYPESTKVIPKRKNYYRHFREMSDGVKGLMEILGSQANIDPALAVSSQWTKPLTKWLSFAQKREGKKTDVDAVGGFIDYLNAALYSKHIDPHIQRFRGVDSELASEAKKTRKFFDDSTIGLAEELSRRVNPISQLAESKDPKEIAKILIEKGLRKPDVVRMTKELVGKNTIDDVTKYLEENLTGEGMGKFAPHAAAEDSENKLNNFLKFLDNYANGLAGKTNPLDRPFQDNFISRKGFAALNWLNSRVKANTIVGNVSSSLAQFFAIPTGAAEAGPVNSLKSVGRTLLDVFDQSSPSANSNFLRERFSRGADRFNPGVLARTKDFAVWLTSIGDKVGSTFTWNANYLKAIERGVPNPVKYADDVTRRIVGGRGIGETPIMQQSKVIQLAMPFQYEVGNLWSVLREWAAEDPKKIALASKLVQYSVYAWMMNSVVKEIRGSDVTFDPIEATLDAAQAYEDADSMGEGALLAGGRIAGEVFSNIPGGSIPASWYPEYGKKDILGTGIDLPTREDLFGDKDPTRFGGGLLASKSLTDPLYSVVFPYAGRQVKNTAKGLESLMDGYTETESGRVMTPVEDSPYNWLKGVLFGPNALQEVQEYRENDQTPLSEQQTEKFKLGIPGYYQSVMDQRAADNEKEALKKANASGQPIARAENLDKNIYQLKDGSFYVPTLRSDTKSFKTQEDAKDALEKENFEDSNENFRDLGEYVLRKREDGSVYPQRKDVFTTSLLSAKMIGAKKSDNYEEWLKFADQKYQLLQKLVEDPSVDELERAEFQNQMMTLEDDFEKFEEYGGAFKKGSKGRKLEEKFRYPLVDPELINIENSLPRGNRLALVAPVPMRVRQPKLVKPRKVRRKQVRV